MTNAGKLKQLMSKLCESPKMKPKGQKQNENQDTYKETLDKQTHKRMKSGDIEKGRHKLNTAST